MFLVMVLSVSRTVAISRPFVRVNIRAVVWAVAGYGLFLLSHFAITILVKMGFYYHPRGAFCFRDIKESSAFTVVHMILLNVECGLPPVLTLVSLLVCVVALLRSTVLIIFIILIIIFYA